MSQAMIVSPSAELVSSATVARAGAAANRAAASYVFRPTSSAGLRTRCAGSVPNSQCGRPGAAAHHNRPDGGCPNTTSSPYGEKYMVRGILFTTWRAWAQLRGITEDEAFKEIIIEESGESTRSHP